MGKTKRDRSKQKKKRTERTAEPAAAPEAVPEKRARPAVPVAQQGMLPRGGAKRAPSAPIADPDQVPDELFGPGEREQLTGVEGVADRKNQKKKKSKKNDTNLGEAFADEHNDTKAKDGGRQSRMLTKQTMKAGALVLGVVQGVVDGKVFLALPGGLTCTLRDDDEEEMELQKCFAIGDELVVCVTSSQPLRVSASPALVAQFQEESRAPAENEAVVGRLGSREDRGWSVHLEGCGSGRTAVLLDEAVPVALRPRMRPGRPMLLRVAKQTGPLLQLDCARGEAHLEAAGGAGAVLPGALLTQIMQAEPTLKQPSDGKRWNLGGGIQGDASFVSLDASPDVRLMVTWSDPDRRVVGLSLPRSASFPPTTPLAERGTGHVALVVRSGLWLTLQDGSKGFCLRSQALEDDGKRAAGGNLETALAMAYKQGDRLEYRLVRDGRSPVDGVVSVAVSSKFRSARWTRVAQLKEGEQAVGVVKRVTPHGAELLLDGAAEQIRVQVPRNHFPPGKSMSVGNAKIPLRIWNLSALNGGLWLPVATAVPGLVEEPKKKKKAKGEDASAVWVYGLVVHIKPQFVLVDIGGGRTALLGATQCSVASRPPSDLAPLFHVGQVLRCRLLPPRAGRPDDLRVSLLSVDRAPPPYDVAERVHKVRVTRLQDEGAELLMPDGETRALLPIAHLGDWPRLAQAAFSRLEVGEEIEQVVVWGHHEVHQLLVTCKPSYLAVAESLPRSLEALTVGTSIPTMTVQRVTKRGVLLKVWGDLAVFCPRDKLSDAWIGPDEDLAGPNWALTAGATLCGEVVATDASGRVTVGCGRSKQPVAAMSRLLAGYATAMPTFPAGLSPGSTVEARVIAAGSWGATLHVTGTDLMLYEACCGRHWSAGWKEKEQHAVVVVDVDPAVRPPLFDVVPLSAVQNAEKGHVLLAKDEVTVVAWMDGAESSSEKKSKKSKKKSKQAAAATTTTKPFQLGLVQSHPEWLSLFRSVRPPSYAVGSTAVLVESGMQSGGSWQLLEPAATAASSTSVDLQLGTVYELAVASVSQHHLNVSKGVSPTCRGRIHMSELVDDAESPSQAPQALLSKYQAGDRVRAVYIGTRNRSDDPLLGLSHAHQKKRSSVNHHFSLRMSRHRGAEGSFTDHGTWLPSVPLFGEINKGDRLVGVVTEHAIDSLWIHVSPYLRGRMFILDATEDEEELKDILKAFPVGTRLPVQVASVDDEGRALDLVRDPPLQRSLKAGSVTLCRVTKREPHMAVLQIASHTHVRVKELDVDDFVHKKSAVEDLVPAVGGFIKARLVQRGEYLDACTRPSVTNVPFPVNAANEKYALSPWSAEPPVVGSLVAGRVSGSSNGREGVFIRLGQGRVARCPLRLVSDDFLEQSEVAELYPAHKRVMARVMSVQEGRIEVSLQQSLLHGEPVTWESVHEGQVVHCNVSKVETYGLFLVVRGSLRVAGLAHRSKIFDQSGLEHQEHYAKGDYVVAKVISYDKEKRKLGFTLKKSAFTPEELAALEEESSSESEDAAAVEEEAMEESSSGSSDSEEEDDSDEAPDAAVAPVLPTVGFGEDSSDDDSSSSSSSSEERHSKKKRPRGAAGQETEAEIAAQEKRLAKRLAVPESDEDFERLLMGSPHSSEVWLRWMAWRLSQSNVDGARQVADKALQRISSSHRRERANIYGALLNLETRYGNEAAVDRVVARGAGELGRLDMDLRLLDALERNDATAQQLEKTVSGVLRRHASSPETWVRVGRLYIRRGMPAQSSELLQRAIKAMPSTAERVLLTSRFAQMEFKEPNGEAERGRTIFWSLLESHPKRIDILIVFLDMEEKLGEWERARQLYKRAVSLKLSSKKMRFFLRRWLEFEKEHGDEQDQAAVMQAAEQYVESKK